ncbi:UDP-N-acetylglucosamine 2-epimerase [Hafnia paralvei]|uniref:UDP-N-acetylglucosamine 2-epimerase n=1 Tax=Hafnia paralvei TaxID=546367 RepID=UPI0029DC0B4F|nr:UDP-N-acetylglucosamine 2-epimerase [Hafnia paralvei]MDX6843126.1 UDP-N-acetylglucosamine 2-epimerase [Hafnia paralvei]
MKKIVYVTGSRAEYGIMKNLLLALDKESGIDLTIVATGMHCEKKYGETYKIIEKDGLSISRLIPIDINTENNAAILKSMSICQLEFGKFFEKNKFDAVILLGDRYEIFSVAIAAAMNNLPIIHIHGGEKTLGNYDEFIRHSITKMSRLHLASTNEYRKRIIQLGEEPSTVFNIGAMGAENCYLMKLPDKKHLEKKFGSLEKPYLVVVFHPETITGVSVTEQINQLLIALNVFRTHYDYFFIGSNSDTGSDKIMSIISEFCQEHKCRLIPSVTPEEYLALNKYSEGIIGNSSSGLIEVPTLRVPTINIGDRQKGRVRGESVIDCDCSADAIITAITKMNSDEFKLQLNNTTNPYFQPNSMRKALQIITDFINNKARDVKDFYDLRAI